MAEETEAQPSITEEATTGGPYDKLIKVVNKVNYNNKADNKKLSEKILTNPALFDKALDDAHKVSKKYKERASLYVK